MSGDSTATATPLSAMVHFLVDRCEINEEDAAQYAAALCTDGYDTLASLCDVEESDWDGYKIKKGHLKRIKRRGASMAPPPEVEGSDGDGEGSDGEGSGSDGGGSVRSAIGSRGGDSTPVPIPSENMELEAAKPAKSGKIVIDNIVLVLSTLAVLVALSWVVLDSAGGKAKRPKVIKAASAQRAAPPERVWRPLIVGSPARRRRLSRRRRLKSGKRASGQRASKGRTSSASRTRAARTASRRRRPSTASRRS